MADQSSKVSKTKKPVKKMIKRLISIFAVLMIFCLIGLTLAGMYVAKHPSSAVPLIAKSIRTFLGLDFSAEDLSYSFAPLQLRARGIKVHSSNGKDDIDLKLGSLDVTARLTGPFGHRTLIIEQLQIASFDGSIQFPIQTPGPLEVMAKPGPRSFSGRIVRLLMRQFLFSDILWSGLDANNGRVSIFNDTWRINATGIKVKATPHAGIDIHSQALEGHSGSRARLTASGFHLHLDPRNISSNGATDGQLRIFDGIIKTPKLEWRKVSVDTQFIIHGERREILLPTVKLDGRATSPLVSPETHHSDFQLSVATRGILRVTERILELPKWSMNAAEHLTASGHARVDLSPPYHMQLNLTDSRLKHPDINYLYSAITGKPRLPLILTGDIGITGDAAGPLAGEITHWQGDLKLILNKVPAEYNHSGTHLSANLFGNVAATGPIVDPRFKIDLDAEGLVVSSSGVTLTEFRPVLRASGRYPFLTIALHTRGTGGRLTAGDLRIDKVKIDMDQGRLDLRAMDLSVPRISLSTETVANLTASFNGKPNRILLRVKGRNTGLLRTAAGLGNLPSDWRYHAEDILDLAFSWQADKGMSMDSRVDVTDFRFSSPEESRIGEAVQARLETTSRFSPSNGVIHSELKLSAASGEVLWDRFYFDLAATPFAVVGKIDWDPVRRRMSVDRLVTSLKDLLSFNISGSVEPGTQHTRMDLVVKMAESKAQNLYQHLIAEPFKFDRPALSEMEIDGRIGGQASFSGDKDALKIKGRAYWKKGYFSKKNGSLTLSGIDLDLPLWYEATPEKKPGHPIRGHLTVVDMQLPRLGNQPLQLEIEISPNHMTIPQPTVLTVFSGQMAVGPLNVNDLYTDRMILKTDVTFSGIDIDSLLVETWPQPTGGNLTGKLESIRLEDSQIVTSGMLSIDIFGGSIDIIDPGMTGLKSSVPVAKFSSRFNGLDLDQMTTGTGFGKIRGILRGTIDNVEIVDNQPQRFDLRIETVKRKGVAQKINIQAVDNIARLGGGGSPFLGMAGSFAKFFREFPYEKIGIAATLENDIFRVNGTIKENGIEYLVKKGGFSGVNVVNLNPDNRIGFKDMVKRIKRISGSQDGPVIR